MGKDNNHESLQSYLFQRKNTTELIFPIQESKKKKGVYSVSFYKQNKTQIKRKVLMHSSIIIQEAWRLNYASDIQK